MTTEISVMYGSEKVNPSAAELFVSIFHSFNPLSPHDALKHHFTSLRADLIFLQLGVLERKFP